MVNEWPVGSDKGMDFTDYLRLDGNRAAGDDDRIWNDAPPSATVFTVGAHDSVNNSGDGSVAYCFASIEGYSKVGSYVGNADNDGTFIYTGFAPAYIWIKNIDSAYDWYQTDNKRAPYNERNKTLYLNNNNAEETYSWVDLDSNGFKIRTSGSGVNTSGEDYLFYAVAESPFKYSTAR